MSESSDADASGLSLEFGPGFTDTERENMVEVLDAGGIRVDNIDIRHRGARADR